MPTPVAEYLLREGSGTTAHDTSGNGFDGTFGGSSSITWNTDGVNFFGFSLDYIQIPDAVLANDDTSATDLTLVAVLKPSLIQKGFIISLCGDVDLYIQSIGSSGIGNYVGDAWSASSLLGQVTSVTTEVTAAWIHVAFVRSGANVYVYLNATLDNTATGTTGAAALSSTWGSKTLGAIPGHQASFVGILGEARVYNTGLSSSDVAADLAACASRYGLPGGGTAPTITDSSPLPNATISQSYSHTFGATGTGPFTWSVTSGSLPSGLSLSSGGVLSGTPTGATGTATFTVQATNTSGSDSKSFSLSTQIVIVSSSPLPQASVGIAYSYTFTGQGASPFTWSISSGALPTGLSLSSAGAISGSPSGALGLYSFTVQMTDSAANTVTKSFTMTMQNGYDESYVGLRDVNDEDSGNQRFFKYAGILYLFSGGSAVKSIDAGVTWAALVTGLMPTPFSGAQVGSTLAGTRIYLLSADGGHVFDAQSYYSYLGYYDLSTVSFTAVSSGTGTPFARSSLRLSGNSPTALFAASSYILASAPTNRLLSLYSFNGSAWSLLCTFDDLSPNIKFPQGQLVGSSGIPHTLFMFSTSASSGTGTSDLVYITPSGVQSTAAASFITGWTDLAAISNMVQLGSKIYTAYVALPSGDLKLLSFDDVSSPSFSIVTIEPSFYGSGTVDCPVTLSVRGGILHVHYTNTAGDGSGDAYLYYRTYNGTAFSARRTILKHFDLGGTNPASSPIISGLGSLTLLPGQTNDPIQITYQNDAGLGTDDRLRYVNWKYSNPSGAPSTANTAFIGSYYALTK